MENLVFSCNWGNEPEKTWSGSSMGLYRELEKHYSIEDFEINHRIPLLFPFSCIEKLGLGRYDMVYMKYYDRLFRKRYSKDQCSKIFQLDECPNVNWADSYIYQDLSISYLLYVYEQKQNLIPYLGLNNLSLHYLKKRVKLQNEYYRNTKGIFTMGVWLRDFLVDECKIPAYLVHAVGGGINVDVNEVKDTYRQQNKFLFVGRDFIRKGGDLVVEAFKLVKERNPETELYIAGPAKNPIQQKDQIEGIHYLGELNKEELHAIYNLCDVFCLPSRFEAYGLVIPEALVFGLPCIGRNAYAMKEFIQDGLNGYLVDADNVEELADKMEKAIHNTDMMRYVKEHREWYRNHYSWEQVVNRIVTVMQ